MKTNEEGKEKERFIIRIESEFQCYLLLEVALSRGLDAWLDQERADEVYMCGSKKAVRSALQTARQAYSLLRLRQLEGVAEAVRSVDETPSAGLLDAIATAKFKAGFRNNNDPPGRLNGDRLSGLN